MRRRAFTLIELILAMSMAAMLALSLYMSMSVAIKAQRTAARTVQNTRNSSVALDLIAQDLASVPNPSGILRGPLIGTHQPGANGSADTLEFHCLGDDSAIDDSPLSDGMRRVDIGIRTDVEPPVLVRQVTRNLLAPSETPPEEEILARNVRALSIEYFDGTGWHDTWDSGTLDNLLPMAVLLTLTLDDPNAAQPNAAPIVLSRMVPMSCGRPLDAAQAGVLP